MFRAMNALQNTCAQKKKGQAWKTASKFAISGKYVRAVSAKRR
jgi:hypothetical protein